ncbi:hypothetical protein ACH5RR_033169 [Cinchona calisaya]|uniref:Uncharacterized protein n=1 Tax=Cinchona calisaya TaxID=153742 RepID=A0ABD2YNB9_9GENT
MWGLKVFKRMSRRSYGLERSKRLRVVMMGIIGVWDYPNLGRKVVSELSMRALRNIKHLNMRNEMGNQNASGIKEEEKAAAEVQEKPQEAAHENVVKGESKDFHEKTAELLPSDDLSVNKDSSAQRLESDEKEQGNKESEHSSRHPETETESNHPVNQENSVDKADSRYDGANYEEPLDSNLEEIMPINDKVEGNDRETDGGEVENTYTNSESKNTFQDSESVDVTTTPLEDHQSLSSHNEGEEVEVLQLSLSCHMEEKQNNQNEINRDENRDDLVLDESSCIEDKSLEMNIGIEKCDSKVTEEKVQNGHGNDGDIQLPHKENLSDISSSPTEIVIEVSPIDTSSETPEPTEKHIVHAEEINLECGRSENPEKEPDTDRPQFSEQIVNQLIGNATSPMIEDETCIKENGEENMAKMTSRSESENVYQTEGIKVIQTTAEQEKEQSSDTQVVVVMMPETYLASNGLTSIDKCDEGGKASDKLLGEETEKRSYDSSSARNSRHNAGTAEESVRSFQSLEGENYLVPVSPTLPFNGENGSSADSYTSSFNHQWSNGLCSEAAEDWNKSTVNLKQYSTSDDFVSEVSTFNAQKASTQTVDPCNANHFQELEQNVQENSGKEADYKQHLISESASRISIESNPDHPVTQVKLRKSPSFEFGIPLDARSEESDQTPLLVRDKSLARTFSSGHANIRFQNTIIATDYGRKSLDYEPVLVEEKTIRMERSNSDVSRDSFMSLLRKDVKQSVELASEKKESHVAEKKALESESSSEEHALTSVKTSGKRKPRSSLFSACICCTAAIH